MEQFEQYRADNRATVKAPPPDYRVRLSTWIRLWILPATHTVISTLVGVQFGVVYGVLTFLGLLWVLCMRLWLLMLSEIGTERREQRRVEAREEDRRIRDQALATMLAQHQEREH